MAKAKITPEDKIAESKKHSKAASVKSKKNKLKAEAKKLSDRMILDIAAELPAGQGNAFVQLNIKHDKADEQVAAANALRRQVRAELKALKVDMTVLNQVRKGRKMDKDDWMAAKVTQALYENQLGMALSPEQEALVAEIEAQRENGRAAMSALPGGTGKEVGSGFNIDDGGIGHNSNGNATPEQIRAAALPSLPERNDSIGKGFRKPEAAGGRL